jgi:transcription elongation factor GreA
MSELFPMTAHGHVALKEKLKTLKTVDRPRAIAQLAEARSHGDLSENAEYDAAREKQSFLEGQISDIEAKLSRAQIIDTTTLSGDKVVFGATVKLLDTEAETEQEWTIVGDDESDLENKKIGISSPIARGLIGKHEGDEVEIRTPKGKKVCEIVKVSFK